MAFKYLEMKSNSIMVTHTNADGEVIPAAEEADIMAIVRRILGSDMLIVTLESVENLGIVLCARIKVSNKRL